ncbi:unnamed protein product [Pseudo-nitzschia multistriata]|uniref:Peptide-methionine (R)-S-oxide reductase n=1 Tax=Pseudo-nitzschia multistriata TaxID=183589 RepID=A0A448ZMU4_9STRA|nr:unnamed protein product [Pseudo-nitzschia multistriata]
MLTKGLGIIVFICLVWGSLSSLAFVQHDRQTAQLLSNNFSDASTRVYVSPNQSDGCSKNDDDLSDSSRRKVMQTGVFSLAMAGMPSRSEAAWKKSRSDGYNFQRTEKEWKSMLTPRQYEILRNGGTERQYSSVLEGEERNGIYSCAGCQSPLFASEAKFHSGTGWPSFATALDGVEIEPLNVVQANLGGAELRCQNCGGHLGDVFRDGFLFVGTPAAESGKRFCIDGSALVFKPSGDGEEVIGDEIPSRVQYYYN